jgi:hypothetical protein
VNMLNKQSRTDNKGCSSSLWVGRGVNTPHRKNKLVTKIIKEPGTWTYSFHKRPKLWNMDMRFGTWNVRSLYRAGSLKTVSWELARYKLDLVRMQEGRLEGGGTEPVGK